MGAIAVDWSGAAAGAARAIYRAQAEGGRLTLLENGLDRAGTAEWLADRAERDPDLLVGLDFAFSLPAWYLTLHGWGRVEELWESGLPAAWLRRSPWPFWGRPGSRRPEGIEHFRRTEQLVEPVAGVRPKSVFQIGGAGAVGTGTLRGLPILRRLRELGFGIWPFDLRLPRVVEIYPRLFTGRVRKTRGEERRAVLSRWGDRIPERLHARAAGSEHAFDAAVSALAMEAQAPLVTPPDHPLAMLEGWIWGAAS